MTISEKAAEKALAILAEEGKDEWGIKIFVAGESCCGLTYGLNFQEEKLPEDEVIEKDGLKIFVDKKLLTYLSGAQLDYYAGDEGEGFVFKGVSSSCSSGCDSCG